MSRLVFLLPLLPLLATGCRQARCVETIREVQVDVRDTVIVTRPDTASLRALVECDSLGNLLVREVETLQGQRAKVNAALSRRSPREVEIRTEYILQADTVYVPTFKLIKAAPAAQPRKPGLWFAWLLVGVIAGCLLSIKLIK